MENINQTEQEKKRSEIPLILLWIIPLVYILAIWKTIPDTVPLHFDIEMKADDFGSKWTFILLTCLWGPLIYFLMYFVPRLDPKKKIKRNTRSFYIIRIAIQVLLSAMSVWIIYITTNYGKTEISFKVIPIMISGFMIILGNYLPTMKQNYFVGFRTPWTLENAEVWQRTHYWSGKAFFYLGMISLLCSIFLPELISIFIVIGFMVSIAVWGIFYSYFLFKKVTRNAKSGVE